MNRGAGCDFSHDDEEDGLLSEGKTPGQEGSLAKQKKLAAKEMKEELEDMIPMVSEMDPQSRKALLDDIEKMRGLTPMNQHGLLSFNCFMHIFIIITRHAKEQHIKELRKTEEIRRRAFKLRDWKEYKKIVQHEIDIERVKYNNIIDYTLN